MKLPAKWIDVRSFGQVFAFKNSDVSLGIRGPVSLHPAFSIDPIDISSIPDYKKRQ